MPRDTGGGWNDPRAVSPLLELELRGKNERVVCRETERMVYKLKVLGHPVTAEVRSSTYRKVTKTRDRRYFSSDGARSNG